MSAEVESAPVEPLAAPKLAPEAAEMEVKPASESVTPEEAVKTPEPAKPSENGDEEPAKSSATSTDAEADINNEKMAEDKLVEQELEVKPPTKPGKPAKPAPKTKPPPKPQRLSQSMSNGSASSPTEESANLPPADGTKSAEKPSSLSLMDEIMGAMKDKAVGSPKTPDDEIVTAEINSPVVETTPEPKAEIATAKPSQDDIKASSPKADPTPPPKPAVKSKPPVKPKVVTPATPEKPKSFLLKTRTSDLSKKTPGTHKHTPLPLSPLEC